MKIHQLLHGYSEGHKLLAGSVSNIPPKDRKKLAVLSDWDEYTTGRDDDSYITCYPLPESNYYAIAKTWYANEMDRPGCVWTHTLLVDCSDDSEFLDLRQLKYCFSRPVEGNYSKYEKPIELNEDKWNDKNKPIQLFDAPSLDYWLHELLYGKTALAFSVEKPSDYYQLLVLSIISHLSKPLMYSFSLCSGTGRVRKYENTVFDLQFITTYKNTAPRFSQPVANTDVEGWCKFVATSIQYGGDSVPRLVSRFSSDIGTSVDRYAAVIIVYELLDRLKEPGEQNVTKFNFALKVMAEVFPNKEDGCYFKSVILSNDLTKYFFDEKEFLFQMASTDCANSFDYESFEYLFRLDNYIANHPITEYAHIIDILIQKTKKLSYIERVLEKKTKVYSDKEIEYLFYNHWPFYSELMIRRPEILDNPVWINAEDGKFGNIFNFFCQRVPDNFDEWDKLFDKIIESKLYVEQTTIEFISKHVDNLVGVLLSKINTNEDVCYMWIDYCKSHPQEIIRWIKTQNRINVAIAKIIIYAIDPESEIIKSTCSSDWKALLHVTIGNDILLKYSVFLFILSYRIDRNDTSFELYKKSFLPIYEATIHNKIDYYWIKIEQYCPKPFFSWQMNRCDMLRKGFVERVINEHRDANVAKKFTTRSQLNKRLYKLVSKELPLKNILPFK